MAAHQAPAEREPLLQAEQPTQPSASADAAGAYSMRVGPHASDAASSSAPTSPKLRVYARRYWVLAMYSLLNFFQGWLWMMWSPVQAVAAARYGWTDSDIFTVLAAWNFFVVAAALPFTSYVIGRIGLRAGVTVSVALVALGAVLRCLTTEAPAALYLANLAAIANSFAAPVVWTLSAPIASMWFPSTSRSTASGFALTFGKLAGVSGGLTGMLVQDSSQLALLLRVQAAAACSLLVLACADHFWPAEPPLPPSLSTQRRTTPRASKAPVAVTAGESHEDSEAAAGPSLRQSLRELGRALAHKQVMVCALAAGLAGGGAACWEAVVNLQLAPFGYSQFTNGGLIVVHAGASVFGSFLVGSLADRCWDVKALLSACLITATVGWSMFTVAAVAGLSAGWLYVFAAIAIASAIGAYPLLFEEAADAVYPDDPVRGTTVVALVSGLTQAVFMVANALLAERASIWMLPCMTAVATLILLLGFAPANARRSIDSEVQAQ